MDVLEQRTKQYWDLSYAAHGRTKKPPCVGDVIEETNDMLANLNPARKLWLQVARMQNQVIEYGGVSSRKKKPKADVLKLQSK